MSNLISNLISINTFTHNNFGDLIIFINEYTLYIFNGIIIINITNMNFNNFCHLIHLTFDILMHLFHKQPIYDINKFCINVRPFLIYFLSNFIYRKMIQFPIFNHLIILIYLHKNYNYSYIYYFSKCKTFLKASPISHI